MGGIVSICIGKRHTGKTTFSKELLSKSKLPKVIYDVNNEYSQFYNEPFQDFNDFMEKVVNLKGHYLLFEEATIFFNPRARVEEMINLLVRARHTQNVIQLNFHSFASVPNNIKDMIDYITIFKTNDNEKVVQSKIDKDYIINAWKKVNASPNKFERITLPME